MKTEVKEKIDALVQNISALGTQDGQAARIEQAPADGQKTPVVH